MFLFAARSLWKHKGSAKARGVSNRNAALKWIQTHVTSGVLYFADDDNTYDYKIFQEVKDLFFLNVIKARWLIIGLRVQYQQFLQYILIQ